MILGHGDLATALKDTDNGIIDRDDVIFFASGVSNSKCEDVNEYQREVRLLWQQDPKKHLVYFSSLCVYYSSTMYAAHKKWMERSVASKFSSYTIIRIGNINFGTNKNTLINFIKNKVLINEEFIILDEYRYVCNKEELLYWIGMIRVGEKDIMNVVGKRMKVVEIYNEIKNGNLL